MSAEIILEDVTARLARSFGRLRREQRARIVTFGSSMTCSLNYSKLLRGEKYFFGLPSAILSPGTVFPPTTHGEFVLLICGAADRILVLPRPLVVDMLVGVTSRRVDVFVEDKTYVMQTTGHPKLDVTPYLNAFPAPRAKQEGVTPEEGAARRPDRIHVRIQYALVSLGRAEGCSVWVPVNDRNLSFMGRPFSAHTLARLPNFGFDENTRRIVQNIDVLWLTKNVIQKAFEIESTTSIYSGLLRLNDLVLAQPNNQIQLYIAASRQRRDKVRSQLMRPSFQQLLARCEFVAFEYIEAQTGRLQNFSAESGARVTGLLRGERFELPENLFYPDYV